MIVKPKVVDAMNAQIQSEFGASAQYIAIAIYFDEEGLPDLAQFFYEQSLEEREHAMKFIHYLLETGAKPLIPGLPNMVNEFESAAAAVEFALGQEQKVTQQIHNILHIATEENDYASINFLQWFVDEQVEEEDSMGTLLQTIKHAGSSLLLVEDFVRRMLAARAAEEGAK
ncbi:MAG: ferritin [Chloroflexi bacterium]|nr:ferritin [Chloroflexota bacterium]